MRDCRAAWVALRSANHERDWALVRAAADGPVPPSVLRLEAAATDLSTSFTANTVFAGAPGRATVRFRVNVTAFPFKGARGWVPLFADVKLRGVAPTSYPSVSSSFVIRFSSSTRRFSDCSKLGAGVAMADAPNPLDDAADDLPVDAIPVPPNPSLFRELRNVSKSSSLVGGGPSARFFSL
jgi:hypothetical protein